jgi:hypothetical protein
MIGVTNRLPHKAANTTQVWVISLEEFSNAPGCRFCLNFFRLVESDQVLLDSGKSLTTSTMAKRLTTLVLIALMLVAPLRALAGADTCPMEAQAATQMPDQMQGEMPAGHCHEMHHGQGDMGHHQGGCALCADCCMASLSLPVSIQFGFIPNPQAILISLFPRDYTGFQPDGPERPPRSAAL